VDVVVPLEVVVVTSVDKLASAGTVMHDFLPRATGAKAKVDKHAVDNFIFTKALKNLTNVRSKWTEQ